MREETSAVTKTVEIDHEKLLGDWFIDVQDDDDARSVPMLADAITIGSSSRADLVVRDSTVSSIHCRVAVRGGGVFVEDLGSKNGTFVSNARVPNAFVGAGSVVTIGRTTLVPSLSVGDESSELGEPLRQIAGGSAVMRRLATNVRRFAKRSAPVLISGETGTGKELVARALHDEGPRASAQFVAINVAALPRELVESELFGHERGAFTGAHARRPGAFELADGGTLFLDEIGELPLDAQPKLLRALDGYEVRRVGATSVAKPLRVRVVAATHVPLEERVRDGQFRRDLFHRLEVFVVELPPLRDRRGDIPVIARRLLRQLASEVGELRLTPGAVARLTAHKWPGNVRELRNVLYRSAAYVADASVIDVVEIERALRGRESSRPISLTPVLARSILREHSGNLSAAARAANYPRTSFRKLLGG